MTCFRDVAEVAGQCCPREPQWFVYEAAQENKIATDALLAMWLRLLLVWCTRATQRLTSRMQS